jgi:dephospho-CoA kinase
LVENEVHRWLSALVVVFVPPELQLSRLLARDQLSQEEANARLHAQLPLSEKVKVAQFVIDNSGSLQKTREAVGHVWKELLSQAGRHRQH